MTQENKTENIVSELKLSRSAVERYFKILEQNPIRPGYEVEARNATKEAVGYISRTSEDRSSDAEGFYTELNDDELTQLLELMKGELLRREALVLHTETLDHEEVGLNNLRRRVEEIAKSRQEEDSYTDKLNHAFDELMFSISRTVGKVEGGDNTSEGLPESDLKRLRANLDKLKALLP